MTGIRVWSVETLLWSERLQRSMEDTALGSLQSQPSAYCVTLGRGRPSLDLESLSVNGDKMVCSSFPGLHEVCIMLSLLLLLFLGGRERRRQLLNSLPSK